MLTRPPKRNAPCWCGSGRKFKHCHLRLQHTPKVSISERDQDYKAIRAMRWCAHPAAKLGECKGRIAACHTVPEGALRAIAERGRVYEYGHLRDYAGRLTSQDPYRPSLVGVGRASTFYLFCSKHDSELFGPVERGSWQITASTAFLWGFRALAYELHAKKAAMEWAKTLPKLQRGRSFEQQVAAWETAKRFEHVMGTSLTCLLEAKDDWDKALMSQDLSRVRFYAVVMDTPPLFLASGVFWPVVDFSGSWIVYPPNESEWTSVSILPFEHGGVVLLSWLEQPRHCCEAFASSLDGLGDSSLPDALVRMAFEFFENLYLQPVWWDGLTSDARASLLRRAVPKERKLKCCLLDDGLRCVHWPVRHRLRGF